MKYGEIDRKRHVVYETVMLELFKIVLRVSMGFMIGLWHQLLLTLFAGSRLASTAQWGNHKEMKSVGQSCHLFAGRAVAVNVVAFSVAAVLSATLTQTLAIVILQATSKEFILKNHLALQ